MGPDIEVSQSRSVGQREPEGRFESALPAARFEDVSDGAGAYGLFAGGGEILR